MQRSFYRPAFFAAMRQHLACCRAWNVAWGHRVFDVACKRERVHRNRSKKISIRVVVNTIKFARSVVRGHPTNLWHPVIWFGCSLLHSSGKIALNTPEKCSRMRVTRDHVHFFSNQIIKLRRGPSLLPIWNCHIPNLDLRRRAVVVFINNNKYTFVILDLSGFNPNWLTEPQASIWLRKLVRLKLHIAYSGMRVRICPARSCIPPLEDDGLDSWPRLYSRPLPVINEIDHWRWGIDKLCSK